MDESRNATKPDKTRDLSMLSASGGHHALDLLYSSLSTSAASFLVN